MDKSGHGKEVTEKGALTPWRLQREGQVRTWKESNQVRGTYSLETTEGGTWSGHGKKATEQGALTPWRPEGGKSQDMERKQPSKGHLLPGDPEGGMNQDMGRK